MGVGFRWRTASHCRGWAVRIRWHGKLSGGAVAYTEDELATKETGAQWQLELSGEYEEAFLSYRVQFAEGFDFWALG